MPIVLTCPICSKKRKIKPSHADKVFTCGSKKCRSARMWQNFKDSLERRVGQSVDEALHQAYVVDRLSYRQICKAWDINTRTLMKLMADCEIEPRERSEAIKTQWEGNEGRRKELAARTSARMQAYFANGGESPSKHPDARRKISEAKKRDNWMRGRTGAKHPNWLGGKLWWRGKEWDDLKEQIRERDNYCCQRCGMIDQECVRAYKGPLQVHHIVPFRLSRDNSPDNLKTLCNRCHTIADHEFVWVL